MEQLPLSANGDVDGKPLSIQGFSGIRVGATSRSSATYGTLEFLLTRLWEKTLGISPVRPRDNFFALGGDSLTAVRLFAELRRLTGQKLPLSTLFQAPTVESMVALLQNEGWSPSWSSLVSIQPTGHKTPFYCVHGAGGNVFEFYDLSRHLGRDYPFYGLQAQGLNGSGKYLTSIQEMALHYLNEIRELQPEGPYYLSGFCMGGQIAYEMAQRLIKEGQRVALLVLIDTYNFNGAPIHLSFSESLTHLKEKIEFNWRNTVRLHLKERAVFLAKKFRHVCNREATSFFASIAGLIKRILSAGRSKRADILLKRINTKAHFSYVPSVYPERLTIIRPQRHFTQLQDLQMGWGGLAKGGVEIVELPIDPGGMFFEPYVQMLAEELKMLIDKAAVIS